MSGGEHSAEDRTEAASPQRLEEARKSGQLPVSRDVTVLASLAGAGFGMAFLVPSLAGRLSDECAALIGQLDRVRLDGGVLFGGSVSSVLLSAGLLIASVALPAAACSIGSVLIQTQFYVGGTPIRFNLSRINPGAGFARIVSQRNVVEFLKSCVRLAIISLIMWSVLVRSPVRAFALMGSDLDWFILAAWDQVQGLAKPLLIVLACFAGADILYVRFEHSRSLRMTKEQVRLEARDSDGDPVIKAKLRRIRQQRARRRMMAKVKTADVVITNPTHYAVALSYDRNTSSAPRIVAKGADLVAARIREEADKYKVPIVPSPPLARALYAVELDHEVPAEHYRAVAEVIAYVWRLNSRLGGAPSP